jgi:hypothetical protein
VAGSPAVAWTGNLRIDFYACGLQLSFDEGRISSIERWTPPADDTASIDASLPVEDFPHLAVA